MKTGLAVIADIHGNTDALRAVLDDISARGIRKVVNLGDTLFGPLDLLGTFDLLRQWDGEIIHIRGNGDRILLEPLMESDGDSLRHSKLLLGKEHRRWIASLPFSHVEQDFTAFHASPDSDTDYLTEALTPGAVGLRAPAEIAEALRRVPQSLVLCGHSHLPHVLAIPALEDGMCAKLLVNPGSVGLPAYEDDLPMPHAMESGSPHARYAIIRRAENRSSKNMGVWSGFFPQVEIVAVSYDWRPMAAMAREIGREAWATALETGRVAKA